MLDHVFTDAIGALRDAMENALLEGQAVEERFQVDVLLGDRFAFEVSYGGSIQFDEHALADGSILDEQFKGMGGWVASTLVRLGDLRFEFLPADPEET